MDLEMSFDWFYGNGTLLDWIGERKSSISVRNELKEHEILNKTVLDIN